MARRPETPRAAMVVGRVERLLALRALPGFADVPSEQLAVIAEHTSERAFRAGDLVFRAGDPAALVYFVLEGTVAVMRGGETLETFGKRDVLGATLAFAREHHPYDVLAKTDTMALELSFVDALDIFEDNFLLLRNTLRKMAAETIKRRALQGAGAGFATPTPSPSPSPSTRGRAAESMDIVHRMATLRATLPFARTRMDVLAQLAGDASEMRAEAGDVLWHAGAAADHIVAIASGRVACDTGSNGQHFVLGSGDALGALDATAGLPRWYTATVEQDLLALHVSTESLLDVLEDHHDIALDIMQNMAQVILESYEEAPDSE